MSEYHLDRRRFLQGAAVTAGVGLAGCARWESPRTDLPSREHADRPEMMAIGDSLYQGVRSLTFAAHLAPYSPPALVAEQLDLPLTVPDDLPQPILWDLEALYRTGFPLDQNILVPLIGTFQLNAWNWLFRRPWSRHEAFDNVSVGSATISSLWEDCYDKHWGRFVNYFKLLEAAPWSSPFFIGEMWYSLNVCVTLNPHRRKDQGAKSQLDQVAERKPRRLLINIGSNEGLFSAAFQGNLKAGAASLERSRGTMVDLANRLAKLPPEIEQIVFNSLIRPRAATNLMPTSIDIPEHRSGDYFDAYGPWLFREDQPISRADMKYFDDTVARQNEDVRAILRDRLGGRLVFVDLYRASDRSDAKHYTDRGLQVNGHRLENVPLNGKTGAFGGGLTGLDNMHPTVPGYAIIADAVLSAIGSARLTDKGRALASDTLLTNIPPFLSDKHSDVLSIARLLRRLGELGIGSRPEERAVARANTSS